MHFVTVHFLTEIALSEDTILQPGHLFLSLRYAMQVPQFIPQGAIRCFSKVTGWIISLNLWINQIIDFIEMQFKMFWEIDDHWIKSNVFVRSCDPLVIKFILIYIAYNVTKMKEGISPQLEHNVPVFIFIVLYCNPAIVISKCCIVWKWKWAILILKMYYSVGVVRSRVYQMTQNLFYVSILTVSGCHDCWLWKWW